MGRWSSLECSSPCHGEGHGFKSRPARRDQKFRIYKIVFDFQYPLGFFRSFFTNNKEVPVKEIHGKSFDVPILFCAKNSCCWVWGTSQ